MPYPVKYFHSGMEGATGVSNVWGNLNSMLKSCLVTGFNVKTITGITRVGTTVTVTFSTTHQYEIAQILLLAGAVQPEYNGEIRVTSKTSNTVSFEVTGTPATPATSSGDWTARVAPLGFQEVFTGDSGRRTVYQSTNVTGSRPMLRVIDAPQVGYDPSWAKWASVCSAASFTDIDTPVGLTCPYDVTAPSRALVSQGNPNFGWFKWYYARGFDYYDTDKTKDAGSGARDWVLCGDSKGFWLFINTTATSIYTNYFSGRYGYGFGEFDSRKPSDPYNSLLIAHDLVSSDQIESYILASSKFPYMNRDGAGKALLRDFTGFLSTSFGFITLGTFGAGNIVSGFDTGVPFPNGSDYAQQIHPVYVQEPLGSIRAVAPGIYAVLNNGGVPDKTVLTGFSEYPDRRFIFIRLARSGTEVNPAIIAFDLTGPWRI